MSHRGACLAALFVVTLLTGGVAWGQPAADDTFDPLRAGSPAERDNRIFDEWITTQLTALRANPDSPEAARNFVDRFTTEYNNEQNSELFKARFAERSSVLFLEELQRGRELDAEVARALADVLLKLQSIRSLEAFKVGITFPDQVTRYKSSQGLAAIHEAIEADARVAAQTLQDIANVGVNEPNGVVAGAIYKALEYPDHVNESVAAITRMIAGRAKLLDDGQADFGRGELPGLMIIDSQAMATGLQNARVDVVKALAVLLRVHVERYATDNLDASTKAAIEETIDKTESILKKLVGNTAGQLPNVSERMQQGGAEGITQMQLELLGWIGSETDERILNQAPWSVAPGAPS